MRIARGDRDSCPASRPTRRPTSPPSRVSLASSPSTPRSSAVCSGAPGVRGPAAGGRRAASWGRPRDNLRDSGKEEAENPEVRVWGTRASPTNDGHRGVRDAEEEKGREEREEEQERGIGDQRCGRHGSLGGLRADFGLSSRTNLRADPRHLDRKRREATAPGQLDGSPAVGSTTGQIEAIDDDRGVLLLLKRDTLHFCP